MTKQEFVDAVAGKTGLSKRDAGAAVDAFLDTVEEALKAGDTVTFTGFGKFHTHPSGGSRGCQPAQSEREGPDQGGDRAEVLGRLAVEEGSSTSAALSSEDDREGLRGPSLLPFQSNVCSSRIRRMQLSFDAADRLVELVEARRGPVPAGDAARELFALASAPTAIARALLDDVVSGDARLSWRGAAVGLAEPPGRRRAARARVVRRVRPRDHRALACAIADRRDRRAAGRGARARSDVRDARQPGRAAADRRSPRSPASARATCGGAPVADLAVRRFLAFAGDAVLVAHNARFDMGFLDRAVERLTGQTGRGAGRRHGLARPTPARPGGRSGSASRHLAHFFGTSAEPCHRALADAVGDGRDPGRPDRARAGARRARRSPTSSSWRRRARAGSTASARSSRGRRRRRARTSSATRTGRRSTSAARATSGRGCARTSPASGSGPPSRRRSARSRGSSGARAAASSRRRSTSCGCCASSGRPRTLAARGPTGTSTSVVAERAGSAAPSRPRTARSRGRGARAPRGAGARRLRRRRPAAARSRRSGCACAGWPTSLRFEDAARLRDRIAALEQRGRAHRRDVRRLRSLRACLVVPARGAGHGAGDLRRRVRSSRGARCRSAAGHGSRSRPACWRRRRRRLRHARRERARTSCSCSRPSCGGRRRSFGSPRSIATRSSRRSNGVALAA